jgi:hypothetical protein
MAAARNASEGSLESLAGTLGHVFGATGSARGLRQHSSHTAIGNGEQRPWWLFIDGHNDCLGATA